MNVCVYKKPEMWQEITKNTKAHHLGEENMMKHITTGQASQQRIIAYIVS